MSSEPPTGRSRSRRASIGCSPGVTMATSCHGRCSAHRSLLERMRTFRPPMSLRRSARRAPRAPARPRTAPARDRSTARRRPPPRVAGRSTDTRARGPEHLVGQQKRGILAEDRLLQLGELVHGSSPSSAASSPRARRTVASASACRPWRYCATLSTTQRRSRNGASATRARANTATS